MMSLTGMHCSIGSKVFVVETMSDEVILQSFYHQTKKRYLTIAIVRAGRVDCGSKDGVGLVITFKGPP